MAYTRDLASKGGQAVAKILGTEVLDNSEGTLADSSMTNVRLPIASSDLGRLDLEEIAEEIKKAMILDRKIAVNVFAYRDAIWARLSAQIYLTLRDFERTAAELQRACARYNSSSSY